METFIEFINVRLYSGDYPVLNGISLSIPHHSCTVILGPSGCGKSSFLKVAAGIYPPDNGKILINGSDFLKFPYKKIKEFRKHTGFVFEDSALWANRTIFDNLALPLEFHFPELSGAQIKEKVYNQLEKVGFTDEANLRPEQLSSSERKVIAFLRGIITAPHNLFLDEPLQSMDHDLARIIIDILKKMKSDNCSLVLVTNNVDLTSKMADYLILLKTGTVVEYGDFNRVKNSTNPASKQILKEILGQAASFDTDLLDLLNG